MGPGLAQSRHQHRTRSARVRVPQNPRSHLVRNQDGHIKLADKLISTCHEAVEHIRLHRRRVYIVTVDEPERIGQAIYNNQPNPFPPVFQ